MSNNPFPEFGKITISDNLLKACRESRSEDAMAIINNAKNAPKNAPKNAAKKLNLNIRDEDGSTPLILASKNGLIDVVTALLEKTSEVNVNQVNSAGETALYLACNNSHAAIAIALLKTPGINKTAKVNDEKGGKVDVVTFCKNKIPAIRYDTSIYGGRRKSHRKPHRKPHHKSRRSNQKSRRR